ncbi:unnamed protein product [Pedinophyceae sp. YPF-701]|nr:unnamed protein product [Pedinophyceae sp. YPF-701]
MSGRRVVKVMAGGVLALACAGGAAADEARGRIADVLGREQVQTAWNDFVAAMRAVTGEGGSTGTRKLHQVVPGLGDLFPGLQGFPDLTSITDLTSFVDLPRLTDFLAGNVGFDIGGLTDLDVSLPWEDLASKLSAFAPPTSLADARQKADEILEQYCEPASLTVGSGDDPVEVGRIEGIPDKYTKLAPVLYQGDVIHSCSGHAFDFTMEPMTCEIDHAAGEAKCVPPRLVYTKEPARCSMPVLHRPPVVWTGMECKHQHEAGVGFEKVFGGTDVVIPLGRLPKDGPLDFSGLDWGNALAQLADSFTADLGGLFDGASVPDLSGLFGGLNGGLIPGVFGGP